MRAPVHPVRAGVPSVSSADPSRDPRSHLAAAIAAVAGARDLDAALDGVLSAADAAMQPAIGAIFLADPDRTGLVLGAIHGIPDEAVPTVVVHAQEPASPF